MLAAALYSRFEDIKTPIMTTKYHSNYLTAGCWSPSRPGVFFTCKDSGELDIWDFAFKQNEPTLGGIVVSDAALQSIRVTKSGQVTETHGNCPQICGGTVSDKPCATEIYLYTLHNPCALFVVQVVTLSCAD